MPTLIESVFDDEDDDAMETLNLVTRQNSPSSPLHDSSAKESDETGFASGWKRTLVNPEKYRDITSDGFFTLSSCSPGFGVHELLNDSHDKWWKTNQNLPHQIWVEFQKKVDVKYLMLYVDYKQDESFCPAELKIELGWSRNDIFYTKHKSCIKPQGWVRLDLANRETRRPNRCMFLMLTVLANHEGGRDCNIRHFRVISPSKPQYDPLDRITLGLLPSLRFIKIRDADSREDFRNTIMNSVTSLR
ncbi:unnamed protein product [Caenorhabditis angaria]|uniref:Anaphase-promoting complex subunit 10 n=1 Tax=Caenorhabditis angaria TaxID=860376 RepID=A0A9P1N3I6_9PELO|nr:unnamed protein product [Caenorhabditis angaria]